MSKASDEIKAAFIWRGGKVEPTFIHPTFSSADGFPVVYEYSDKGDFLRTLSCLGDIWAMSELELLRKVVAMYSRNRPNFCGNCGVKL